MILFDKNLEDLKVDRSIDDSSSLEEKLILLLLCCLRSDLGRMILDLQSSSSGMIECLIVFGEVCLCSTTSWPVDSDMIYFGGKDQNSSVKKCLERIGKWGGVDVFI